MMRGSIDFEESGVYEDDVWQGRVMGVGFKVVTVGHLVRTFSQISIHSFQRFTSKAQKNKSRNYTETMN